MEVIITLITYSTHGTVYNPFIRILKRNPDHNSHFTQTNLKEHHYISGGSRGEGASPSLGVSTFTGAATSLPNLGPGGPEVQGVRVSMQAP